MAAEWAPENHGWLRTEDDQLTVNWFEGDMMPSTLVKMLKPCDDDPDDDEVEESDSEEESSEDEDE